jgi:hypothetical protein
MEVGPEEKVSFGEVGPLAPSLLMQKSPLHHNYRPPSNLGAKPGSRYDLTTSQEWPPGQPPAAVA